MNINVALLLSIVILAGLLGCTENQLEERPIPSQLPPQPQPLPSNDADQVVLQIQNVTADVQGDTEQNVTADVESKGDPYRKREEARRELEELLKHTPTSFTVTYHITSTNQPDALVTLYVTKQQMRSDTTISLEHQNIETRTIFRENEMITCRKEESWKCYSITAPRAPPRENTALNMTLNITRAPSRTIAGTKTECYTAFNTTNCYSKEGILLYSATHGPAGSMIEEATSYALTIPAGVFTPPATPTTQYPPTYY